MKLAAELRAVHRVDEVEELDGLLGLVRLQLPDQVPRHRPPELGDLRAGLLDPVLPERRDTRGDRLADARRLHRLRDADQEHLLRPASPALSGAGDALAHTFETGPDVRHGRTAILR